jgi:hypothetical protein
MPVMKLIQYIHKYFFPIKENLSIHDYIQPTIVDVYMHLLTTKNAFFLFLCGL